MEGTASVGTIIERGWNETPLPDIRNRAGSRTHFLGGQRATLGNFFVD
jgi:hypothetical protein